MSEPTLTDFLLARIAEDEALWTLARDAKARLVAESALSDAYIPTAFAERLLAECEAKRRIVEMHGGGVHRCITGRVTFANDCTEKRVLAAIYADHPDYRDEWRP